MRDARGQDRSEFVTLQGRGTAPGLACGPLRRNRSDRAPEELLGCVLLAERAVPDDLGRILAAAGTVTVAGAILSHVSLLSRELGKPSVSLSGTGRARIGVEEDGALLDIADEESGASFCSVDEGDVVLLDGDRGTLRIPGGLDRDSRLSLRGLHRTLLAFARNPQPGATLDALADAARDPHGAEIPFLLEAGLVHRVVPEGRPALLLLDALFGGGARRSMLEPRVRFLHARVVAATVGRHAKAREAIRTSEDPDEIDRIVAGLDASVRRARSLLLDLGSDPADLGGLVESAASEAIARREALRVRVSREVAAAAELADAPFHERASAFHALLRRAGRSGISGDASARLAARLAARTSFCAAGRAAPLVLALDGTSFADRALVGGKAAGLLEVHGLLPDGCRIPRGFVLTSSAYRMHVDGEIEEQLRVIVRAGYDEAEVSRRARAAILSGEVPAEVARSIATLLSGLLARRLAVRSSATVEDGSAGSLAGLFDTFLGVSGLPELLNRVRWAWASLWNARALRTLAAAGLSPLDAGQAVLIQETVETKAAGVLVARDAGRGADTLLVNSAWGLGEGISQGGVEGDLFWVRRSTGELLTSQIGSYAKQIVLDPRGTGTIEALVPPDRTGRPSLDGGQLARLAALARVLEGSGRAIREVEFGFSDDGTLLVFQVRPAHASSIAADDAGVAAP